MNTRKLLSFITILVVLCAAVAADVLFWRHIERQSQHQQQQWQVQMQNLSAQLDQQRIALTDTQNKLTQLIRMSNQNATQQALNEVSYLIDLANIYLQINHDVDNGVKSLLLAQHRLRTIPDPSLLPLQQALASDINKLNNVPRVDSADVLIRLQVLSESMSQIDLIPKKIKSPVANTPEAVAAPNQRWYAKFSNSLLTNFKSLLIIRYHSNNNLPILPPDQREFVRENIEFTLKLAQWAVLQQKPILYQQSLSSVHLWLISYYVDTPLRKKILDQLATLMSINIGAEIPAIHDTLQALQQALNHAPNGTETKLPAITPAPIIPSPAPTTPLPPTSEPPAPTGIEI